MPCQTSSLEASFVQSIELFVGGGMVGSPYAGLMFRPRWPAWQSTLLGTSSNKNEFSVPAEAAKGNLCNAG